MLFLSSVINITLHVLRNCVWTSKLKHSYLFFSKGCLSCLFLNPIEHDRIFSDFTVIVNFYSVIDTAQGTAWSLIGVT